LRRFHSPIISAAQSDFDCRYQAAGDASFGNEPLNTDLLEFDAQYLNVIVSFPLIDPDGELARPIAED
jgi:hypothetical protein